MEAVFFTKDEFTKISKGVRGITINTFTSEGNDYNIRYVVRELMRRLGASPELIQQFSREFKEAKTYCEKLKVAREWINIEFINSDC